MYPFSVGILVDDENLRNELIHTLGEFPCRISADLEQCRTVDQTVRRIVNTKPDVVFAELGKACGGPEDLIAELRQAMPHPVVVGLHGSPTVDVVVSALRAGVNEFLHPPIQDNVRAFMSRLQSGFRRRGQGKVVGFLSAKGGCGSTTLACHSALEVARRAADQKKRALLMDLDLNAGLTRFMLKTDSAYSVSDAINNLSKLDVDYWRRLVSSAYPGLDVLSGPEAGRSCNLVHRNHLEHVLGFVRAHYDWAMLDLGKGFGQVAETALAEINEIFLITTAEVGSLHSARTVLNRLAQAGCPRDNIRVILNRAPRSTPEIREQVEKALGLPISVSVANDYCTLVECSLSGSLLSKHSQLAGDIQTLAYRVMDEARPAKQASRMSRALTLCTSWIRA